MPSNSGAVSCKALSAPIASAVRSAVFTRSGPSAMAVIVPVPAFSLSRRAVSIAYSSNGLTTHSISVVSTKPVWVLTRIFVSVDGTCLMQTVMFTGQDALSRQQAGVVPAEPERIGQGGPDSSSRAPRP